MSHGNQGLPSPDAYAGDRYTMTEAARLKGVSYHTVSRAVRSGKLPAQRLGRMALIAAQDLHAWRPMRERAPRKYRQAEPAPATRPALSGINDTIDYAGRLAIATQQILEVASGEGLDRFGDWAAQWLTSNLNARVAVVWKFTHDANVLAPYGTFGVDTASLSRPPGGQMLEFLKHRIRADDVVILDQSQRRLVGGARWMAHDATALLIPMRAGNRAVGCAIVVADDGDEPFDSTDRQFASRLGRQAAFAIEHVHLRRESQKQPLSRVALLNNLPLQLLATDADGTIIYMNQPMIDAWGDDVRTRCLGRHYSHFIRSFRRETLSGVEVPLDEHPLTRAMHGETVHETRVLVPNRFDVPKVFVLTGHPVQDARGNQSGAILTAREVTDELAPVDDASISPVTMLAEARRRVELLTDLARELAERNDPERVFDIVTRRACALLDADYSLVMTPGSDQHMIIRAAHNISGDLAGRVLTRLSVPSAIMAMAEREILYVNDEQAGPGGQEILRAGGARAALLIPLVDSEQALGVLIVHYRSVARLRQVDPELARTVGRMCGNAVHLRNFAVELESSRRRLLTTLDQLPQAIVIVDSPNGHVVAMNREAQAMWGPSQDRLGQHASDIVLLDDQGDAIPVERHPFLEPLRSGQTTFGVPLITRDQDGHLVDIVANLAPVMGTSGELRGAVAVLHRREHFKPIDQAKDEFITVVAHELRNPLTSLRGNLQLLERRLDTMDSDVARREVERVAAVIGQVDRVSNLVSRMLDVSRADLGKLTIDPGDTDAVQIARSAIDDVSGQVEGRQIVLDAPGTLQVRWDQVRVQQILVNLLTNAVRYAPDGDIEVAMADDHGGRVAIAVRDHGPGVPSKLRRRLFRLYYRFDAGEENDDALATKQRGLGIGLFISARLAHAHGGSLTVSDAPGGGAVFTLRLPRIATASESAM